MTELDPSNEPELNKLSEDSIKTVLNAFSPSDKFFEELKLEDVGTRYEHLSQVIDLWEDTIRIIEGRAYKTKQDNLKILALKLVIHQLRLTMSGMADYNTFEGELVKLINHVPKAEYIYGGRGTPLKDLNFTKKKSRLWNNDAVEKFEDIT